MGWNGKAKNIKIHTWGLFLHLHFYFGSVGAQSHISRLYTCSSTNTDRDLKLYTILLVQAELQWMQCFVNSPIYRAHIHMFISCWLAEHTLCSFFMHGMLKDRSLVQGSACAHRNITHHHCLIFSLFTSSIVISNCMWHFQGNQSIYLRELKSQIEAPWALLRK